MPRKSDLYEQLNSLPSKEALIGLLCGFYDSTSLAELVEYCKDEGYHIESN